MTVLRGMFFWIKAELGHPERNSGKPPRKSEVDMQIAVRRFDRLTLEKSSSIDTTGPRDCGSRWRRCLNRKADTNRPRLYKGRAP